MTGEHERRPEDVQADWAERIVAGLVDGGARHFVLSPGSRSTPLVLALAAVGHGERHNIAVDTVIDERSAAFFALGRVRASGEPSVLICTSGTAGGHYLPAMMEAAASGLPLVALTADRPPELQECGANQTIDQHGLFSPHARTISMGTANGSRRALLAARRRAQQAVVESVSSRPGPVHLNAKFRKPLEPSRGRRPVALTPATKMFTPRAAPADGAIEALLTACQGRGMLALGPDPRAPRSRAAKIQALGTRLGFPIIADVTSQVARVRTFSLEDAALRSPRFERDAHGALRDDAPTVVLQLGRAPIGKGFELFCERNPELSRIVVDPLGFPDPHGTAELLIQADIDLVLDAVLARLENDAVKEPDRAFSRRVASLEARADELRQACLPETLSEPAVARAVVGALAPRDQLMIGNSLVARHVDRWADARETSRVISQRGVSGIDGLIAGASGAASVAGVGATFLLLGDVSFLHDIGSLALARASRAPLVIVVINNNGGRIFEELPIARRDDLGDGLERFTTPHGMTLATAATLFSVEYARPGTPIALAEALRDARERGCSIIEAVVPPSEARALFASLCTRVSDAL